MRRVFVLVGGFLAACGGAPTPQAARPRRVAAAGSGAHPRTLGKRLVTVSDGGWLMHAPVDSPHASRSSRKVASGYRADLTSAPEAPAARRSCR